MLHAFEEWPCRQPPVCVEDQAGIRATFRGVITCVYPIYRLFLEADPDTPPLVDAPPEEVHRKWVPWTWPAHLPPSLMSMLDLREVVRACLATLALSAAAAEGLRSADRPRLASMAAATAEVMLTVAQFARDTSDTSRTSRLWTDEWFSRMTSLLRQALENLFRIDQL